MESLLTGVDTLWTLIGAALVFFMQAGFGMVEAGLIRAKNVTNILTKNFLDFCISSIGFFLFGYAIMFGSGNGFMGFSGWFMNNAPNPSKLPLFAFWFFQVTFCGAAATIVAGGMAERMKFRAYLIYSFLVSTLIYPIIGHWIWNSQGWLAQLGFADFAGSTVVHTTGGVAALVGTIMLRPRLGKFRADGSVKAIPAHNMALVSLGVFILWFGWFGFNGASTLSVGDGSLIGRIVMNTNLAAAAGGITALIVVWFLFKKPDLSMASNGALAGLVGVTAPCAFIDPWAAIVIGTVSGVLVILGVIILDKLKVDDPVGAFPVHGMNGIWGTLSIGLFGKAALGLSADGLLTGGGLAGLKMLGVQALGVFSVAIFVMLSMTLIFWLISKTVGLRVKREEELKGLDIAEHGMEAYQGFQIID